MKNPFFRKMADMKYNYEFPRDFLYISDFKLKKTTILVQENSTMDSGIPSVDEIQQKQQQQAEYEERRAMILDQLLEPKAKER